MKRLLLLILLGITSSVFGQMTITQSDFLALVGKAKTRSTFRSSDQTAIATLIAKSGQGQTWDLSAISFTAEGTTSEELIAGTAGAVGAEDPAFATATHYVKSSASAKPDSTVYLFLSITSDAASNLGVTVDSFGTPFKLYYTPPFKYIQFPLSYGSQWTSTTTLSFSSQPGYEIPITYMFEVDGEGTLMLPGGASKQVLRLKSVQIMSIGSFNDTTTAYTFVNKNDREAATIVAPKPSPFPPLPGTPGSITYYIGGGGGGGNDVTDAPQQISPADGATISGTQVSLEWGTVQKATSYHVQVSEAPDFQSILNDDPVSGTAKTYSLASGQYYWRVAGVSAENKKGPWSSVRSFTMEQLSVEKDDQVHIRIVPNPANEYVTISNIEGNYQTYELRDVLGRTVRTANINTSEQPMTIDLRSLLPGSYWLVLTNTGGESVTRKIIIE